MKDQCQKNNMIHTAGMEIKLASCHYKTNACARSVFNEQITPNIHCSYRKKILECMHKKENSCLKPKTKYVLSYLILQFSIPSFKNRILQETVNDLFSSSSKRSAR